LRTQFPHEFALYDRRPLPIGSFFLNSLARSTRKRERALPQRWYDKIPLTRHCGLYDPGYGDWEIRQKKKKKALI
jgi:hypothetical protein